MCSVEPLLFSTRFDLLADDTCASKKSEKIDQAKANVPLQAFDPSSHASTMTTTRKLLVVDWDYICKSSNVAQKRVWIQGVCVQVKGNSIVVDDGSGTIAVKATELSLVCQVVSQPSFQQR